MGQLQPNVWATAATVVADARYGQNADFRSGLAGRGIADVVAVRPCRFPP
ncbi:hypothetical protein ACIPSA_36125 [Streptomyces sp. NPDC086549]